MPTRHPRIGVLRDPELDGALRRSRARLGGRSDAARVRELALLGARALEEQPGTADPSRELLLRRHAGRSEAGDLLGLAPHRVPWAARAGTDALDWARGDR